MNLIVPVSKLTSKAQTVIPREVRDRLGLKPGDFVRYVFDGKKVTIERALAEGEDDPFATFAEWAGAADEKAYGGL
jgi:antitoxin PrlF